VTCKGNNLAETSDSIALPARSHLSSGMQTVVLLALLLFLTTVSYIDRQVLSIAAPVLRTRFSMSDFNYSEVLSAFLVSYAFFQPVMGRFIDWIGTRVGLALGVIFWSAVSMLHATARSAFSFGVCRFMLGVGEAGNLPGCVRVVAEQVPAELRSLATGIFNVGAGLGAIVAPPLVAWLITTWGWQVAFLATGSIGFLWLPAWLLLYRPGRRSAEAGAVGNKREFNDETGSFSWITLLCDRRVWALAVARFISDPAWYFYLFWLPEYLHSARGFSLRQIGHFAWIPFLTADLGSVAGGSVSTYFLRRGWSLNKARKAVMGGSAACMPVAIAAATTSDPYTAIALVSVATFAHQAWSANMITLPADLFPSKVVATVSGLSGFSSSVGGMAFMLVIGWVVDHFSYVPIFIAVGVMHPLAATVLFLMIPQFENGVRGPSGSQCVVKV
jgi:MFS transporter, ACS family, hexuronate transporter